MMNLFAVLTNTGFHLAGWRHPSAWTDTMMNLGQYIDFAQKAEAAKLDAIFLADGNGVRDLDQPEIYKALRVDGRPSVFEPLTLFSALSQHTSRIGFVATAVTSFDQPYFVARRFASLDHLSGGRAGWNIVTGSYEDDALNFNRDAHEEKELRYERAHEFVDVCVGLWSGWKENAFPEDKATGVYADPEKVSSLNHKGRFYQVRGPLNIMTPPQGRPLLVHAGQSEGGRDLAARYADAIFAAVRTKAASQELRADILERARRFGRDPKEIKFLPGMTPYHGSSKKDAEARIAGLSELIPPAVGIQHLVHSVKHPFTVEDLDKPMPLLEADVIGAGSPRKLVNEYVRADAVTVRQAYQRLIPGLGLPIFAGTATDIADEMEDWYRDGACDGFMVGLPVVPIDLDSFTQEVVPELQRRGLFRREYGDGTLRDVMGYPKAS